MVTAKNIRGLQLISRETQTNTLFYLHNAHGDVTQLLDEKGQVIKDYRYDPYGNEEDGEAIAFGGQQTQSVWRQEIEKIDNPFRYCGEYLDEETGNYYLRARYYDPSIQRFVNEDSYGVAIGAGWQEHLYGYAANNPIKYIDPRGHAATIGRLEFGDKNNDVLWVQRMLIQLGYDLPSGADGDFGGETQDVVNQFKTDFHLTNTGKDKGVFGPTSLHVLQMALCHLDVTPAQRNTGMALIINSPDALGPINGHEAIVLIDTSTNKARYYSFDPGEDWGTPDDNGVVLKFEPNGTSSSDIDWLMDKINSNRVENDLTKYNKDSVIYVLDISAGNLAKMDNYAAAKRSNDCITDPRRNYKFLGYNCLNFVQGVLNAGGITTPAGIRPNEWHKKLKDIIA